MVRTPPPRPEEDTRRGWRAASRMRPSALQQHRHASVARRWQPEASRRGGPGLGGLGQPPIQDVEHERVDREAAEERMLAQDRGLAPEVLLEIGEAAVPDSRSLIRDAAILGDPCPEGVLVEVLKTAARVLDQHDLLGPQQLDADDQRADDVAGDQAARVPDEGGVAAA